MRMSIGAGPNPSLTGEDPEPLGSSDGHTSSGSRSLEHARYEESTCEADNEFHGPASTTTFMKHIREIIEDGTPTNVASVSQLRQSTSHIPLRSPDHMLPPRQLADSFARPLLGIRASVISLLAQTGLRWDVRKFVHWPGISQ